MFKGLNVMPIYLKIKNKKNKGPTVEKTQLQVKKEYNKGLVSSGRNKGLKRPKEKKRKR